MAFKKFVISKLTKDSSSSTTKPWYKPEVIQTNELKGLKFIKLISEEEERNKQTPYDLRMLKKYKRQLSKKNILAKIYEEPQNIQIINNVTKTLKQEDISDLKNIFGQAKISNIDITTIRKKNKIDLQKNKAIFRIKW